MTYPPTTPPPPTPSNDGSADGAKEKAAAAAGTAQDQAAAVAGTAKEQAANVAGTAKEQVANIAGTATEQARNLLSEAQSELTAQTTAQKDRAVTGLRSLSKDLAAMADHGDDGVAGHLVGEAAKRTGTLAQYLEEREPEHLLDDLRDLGRRRTGGFLLGAALLGFAGGRLLKGARSDGGGRADSGAHAETGADDTAIPAGLPAPMTSAPGVTPHEPGQDDEPTTLTDRQGSLAPTPGLVSPDNV